MTTRKINYLHGDLFDLIPNKENPNTLFFIPHVCNSRAVWGSGFVIPLKKRWPHVEKQSNRLGDTTIVEAENNIFVANMVAQTLYESDPPLRYRALVDCMVYLIEEIKNIHYDSDGYLQSVIFAPKFGSERAGGNWDVIEALIKEIWLPVCDVTICVYP